MDAFLIVLVVAVLVEAVVQVVKGWVPEDKKAEWIWRVISAALGIFVCVLASIDIFAILDVDLQIPIAGQVLSGVLVSQGASFLHDLWGRLKGE